MSGINDDEVTSAAPEEEEEDEDDDDGGEDDDDEVRPCILLCGRPEWIPRGIRLSVCAHLCSNSILEPPFRSS